MTWENTFRQVEPACLPEIEKSANLKELESVRIRYLGRKGKLTELLKQLKNLPLEKRRKFGPLANGLRDRFESLFRERESALKKRQTETELRGTSLDLTLPAFPFALGHSHPLSQTLEHMTDILERLGFSWADGPLVETDFFNFQALNFPPEHPARDSQDTLYVRDAGRNPGKEGTLLMRTHTSPVQIRAMLNRKPPIRIMCPGRVFRHDAVDATHSSVFSQVEGLYVDRRVSMADLKGTLDIFLKELFGPGTEMRFRPAYFPFVEPGAEVDLKCIFCKGTGCSICKQSGYLEMLGAGLVHPDVLKNVNYDHENLTGFAFGIGVERVAMFLLGINDIRLFYENDLKFLEQF